MNDREPPDVVDLRRYRKDKAQTAQRQAAERKARGREPVLGSRPGAAVILLLVILAALALWLGPALL